MSISHRVVRPESAWPGNPGKAVPLLGWAIAMAAILLAPRVSPGQYQPKRHYLQSARQLPGTVGQGQLLRGGPLVGYYQPVEVFVPSGARVSVFEGGAFSPPQPGSLKAGLLIGQVYRFKITGIPLREGFEVYPTVELVNRTYPPPGLELRFPVPIDLTQQELEYALDGKYVTRVIYLEDPRTALPRRQVGDQQRYFELGTSEDPLEVADRLGRPVAILRMGSRLPDYSGPGAGFTFNGPPLLRFPSSPAPRPPDAWPLPGSEPDQRSDTEMWGIEDGLRGKNFPRQPVRYAQPGFPPERIRR